MTRDEAILAIDQGSSATKAMLVALDGAIIASAAAPVGHTFPSPGWVEQSPTELVDSVRRAVGQCLDQRPESRVLAVGLANQRESLVLWERTTGKPVLPLVSWQDQRTVGLCAEFVRRGHGPEVRRLSGLPLDPMFSAAKARWLLDAADPDRSRSRRGELCLGTVDSWLLAHFGGEHVVEVGNASRTQLLNIATREWDPALLELFGIPFEVLPRVVASTGPFPAVRDVAPLPDGTPVRAVLGDSHAALFAHARREVGQVKVTYGTGSSVMSLCSPGAAPPEGLCLTVAWEDGSPAYALEGNIRASGATLSWLARAVGSDPAALADLAATSTSDGVYVVPAFSGLGAPYWDPGAVGLISGLTLGASLAQIARAALESVAFQVEDVVSAVDASTPVRAILADGGASRNSTLMQLQADIGGREVHRAIDGDLSALGAAYFAGRAAGIWNDQDLDRLPHRQERFQPLSSEDERARMLAGWRSAIDRSRGLRVGGHDGSSARDVTAPGQ
jgi:glycerol kinase